MNYYAFGMKRPDTTQNYDLMTGLDNGTGYRYGYNGKEQDFSFHNTDGENYDFGARIYDPRLGRWLAVDPASGQTAYVSPFNGFGNNPIIYIDPDGKKDKPFNSTTDKPITPVPGTATKLELYDATGVFIGYNTEANNCHTFSWHAGYSDPTDPANAYLIAEGVTLWDNDASDDIISLGTRQLSATADNLVGDRLIYYNDANMNGQYDAGEIIQHSAVVSKVDANGYTTEVTSKMGQLEMSTNHPDAPGYYEGSSSSPTSRAYIREPGRSSYTIKSGDTLSEIAERYGTSVTNIQSVNPIITDPGIISPGDAITIN